MLDLPIRMRRNRQSESIRNLVRETRLHPHDFVYPLFIKEGESGSDPIASLSGQSRHTVSSAVEVCKRAWDAGIQGVALFPAVPESKKNAKATEGLNPNNLVCQSLVAIKNAVPGLTVITDIALDPYSSDGHDGIVRDGKILNDETVDVLAQMAVLHAQYGADVVAPSDMMDGRIGAIRSALDKQSYTDTLILSYAAKYASSLYGPFRDALNSQPKSGNKKSYQMDPANTREAIKEVELDIEEGADIVMVKPGGFYLDIIRDIRQSFTVPVAAYQVSGEYAMIHHPSHTPDQCKDILLESLLALKRAGSDIIFTYGALEIVTAL